MDGNESTMWHSNYGQGETDVVDFNSPDDKNNTYTITLDEAEDIVRFIYVPKQTTGGSDNGIITKLNLYGSEDDGDTYTKINEQEIIWARNRTKKEVNFAPRKIKKLRIEVLALEAVAEVSEEGKKMTVQASYLASDILCTHMADSVSIGSLVNMEVGKMRLLTPAVQMDDGSFLSVKHEYTSDNPTVASVDPNGLITAAATGTANITVKTTLPGQDASVRTVVVEVFPEESMFLHPEMKYKKPAANEYPEIAEVWLNTERDDKHPTFITDIATGEAHWEAVDQENPVTVEKKEGLIGFNG